MTSGPSVVSSKGRSFQMDAAVPEPQLKSAVLHVKRVFVPEGVDPFSTVEWKRADAVQVNREGKEIFRQSDVEVPAWWSESQINVVVAQYFRMVGGKRETSA